MKLDWIKRLPPGEYTIQQIKEFGKLSSKSSAKNMLIKYGAKVKLVRVDGTDVFKNIFIWKGFKVSEKRIRSKKACLLKEIDK